MVIDTMYSKILDSQKFGTAKTTIHSHQKPCGYIDQMTLNNISNVIKQ